MGDIRWAAVAWMAAGFVLAGCAGPPGTAAQTSARRAEGTLLWQAWWQGCQQSMLHFYQPLEEVQARLPAGWQAAGVVPPAMPQPPVDLGQVSIGVYRCSDAGDGQPIAGGMIGLRVEAPVVAPGDTGRHYYAIAQYASATELLDRLNRSGRWAYLALSLHLELDGGAGLVGNAALTGNDGAMLHWSGTGLNQDSIDADRDSRWWRGAPGQRVSIGFRGPARSSYGLVNYCEFSDGSLAEYATGLTWCESGDASIEQLPSWPAGMLVEVRRERRS